MIAPERRVRFGGRQRETEIAIVVGAVSVVTMAIDHLIGTEAEPDESQAAEPIVLFRFVVRPARRDAERAARRAVLYAAFAVVTVPLLFLAVPFPFAGAAIAMGLTGRASRRRRLATAGAAVGAVIVALGLAAYLA